ncbi:putative lipase LipD [Mycobacterium tuberculosis H37Rv] [Mycobacterium shimoidei]|uniref:Putative lipase LipD [Mycobacterium tuberculosis H37Rv] n=1 Tax=Mycobacterium shimoidei TaxID=29313 RepID=A0A375YVS6_MYCSH|nr:serine hydrolase domain-containing protein [Mycobacterium shimoidei]SRX93043.1 putative lipase LipD [Mycobacterium tuberculosis H37Rv] [Mycobacterium shimoidei]
MDSAYVIHEHRGSWLPDGVYGAADPSFACAIRCFAGLFPSRRLGGGSLSVYLDGWPVVDVWTGWADRDGSVPWSADTGATVFSATKGLTSTVIHRLVDRGLLAYDAPVAEYWPEFGANGKSAITIGDVMRHRAGLSHLDGATAADLMDHQLMEARLAAAPAGRLLGKPAYHALTYGWLMSGLARAVTGKGMRELIRVELAQPLNTDGLHLGRPPAESPTQTAHIIAPQSSKANPLFNFAAPKLAKLPFSAAFGAMYFPGMKAYVQGDIPMLDGEVPAANGVCTARALARLYGAIANGGRIDKTQFLSPELVSRLTGKPSLRPDRNLFLPLAWHMGYHAVPLPGVLPGFGHAGMGGSIGWADPSSGMAFGFVHNRLLTPMVFDQATFIGLGALLRRGVAAAQRYGFHIVPDLGAPYPQPADGRHRIDPHCHRRSSSSC